MIPVGLLVQRARGVVIVYARVSSGGADDVDRDVRVASLTEKITHFTLMCPFL